LGVKLFKQKLSCRKQSRKQQLFIKVFTLEGKFLNSIKAEPAQIQGPFAVAVSNAGQVFITDTAKQCVRVFE